MSLGVMRIREICIKEMNRFGAMESGAVKEIEITTDKRT